MAAPLEAAVSYRSYFQVWTAVAPMLADSDNTFTLTLSKDGARQTAATVTLSLTKPDGTAALTGVAVAHTANGVYVYNAAPSATPVAGTYIAIWNAVLTGKTWHREEAVIVSA